MDAMREIRPRPRSAPATATIAAMLQPAVPLLAAALLVTTGFLVAAAFAGP